MPVITLPDGSQRLFDAPVSVGEVAANIRSYYPAEPYKGKCVRYVGERVRRKEGKTVA